jgi:hypothetical protein
MNAAANLLSQFVVQNNIHTVRQCFAINEQLQPRKTGVVCRETTKVPRKSAFRLDLQPYFMYSMNKKPRVRIADRN